MSTVHFNDFSEFYIKHATTVCLYIIAGGSVIGIYLLLQRKENTKSSNITIAKISTSQQVPKHDTNDLFILLLWIVTSISLYPTNKYCAWFVVIINSVLLWFLVAYNYGWENLIVK